MKNLLQKNINHLRVKKWGDLSRQIAPIPTMSQSGPEQGQENIFLGREEIYLKKFKYAL